MNTNVGNYNMNRTLMQLNEDAMAIDAMVEDYAIEHEGDITEIATIIDQWLEDNATQLQAKLEGYVAIIREYEARAKVRKEEAKRIVNLAKTDEAQAAHLRSRLKWYFESNDIAKVETNTAKISLVNNGGKLPVVITCDVEPEQLEERFQKVSVDIDKAAIFEALEHGELLEFAKLGERGKSLRIK